MYRGAKYRAMQVGSAGPVGLLLPARRIPLDPADLFVRAVRPEPAGEDLTLLRATDLPSSVRMV